MEYSSINHKSFDGQYNGSNKLEERRKLKMKPSAKIVLSLFIIGLFGTSLTAKTINAVSTDPYLEVKPNNYVANKLVTFDIEVWLNDITEEDRLIAVEFTLTFDDTLLQFMGAAEGPFLKGFNPNTYFVAVPNTDHVTVGILMLPINDPPYVFPEGSGSLATITFQGISLPPELYTPYGCDLALEGIILVDDSTNEIPYGSPVNGHYEIILTLLGDVNFDSKVDIKDIALAAWAFGAYGPDYAYPGSPPHPRWQPVGPLADVNDDNKVDIRDITMIAKNFGKTYP